jgi:serine phosphatase RsbU (regulator of sigma subunit)
MRRSEEKPSNRSTTLTALIFSFGAFVLVSLIQYRELNVVDIREKLASEKKIIELPSWEGTFFWCDDQATGKCEQLNNQPLEVIFPGEYTIPPLLAKLPRKPNHVRLRKSLTEEHKAWFARMPGSTATLIFPYMYHKATRMLLPADSRLYVGNRSDIRLPLSLDAIQVGSLELELLISEKAEWFGPSRLAPAFVDPRADREFIDISSKLQMSAHMNRMLEVLVPFMFAAMAIVLDHSLVAGILSLFAAIRAIRCLAYFAWDTDFLRSLVSNPTQEMDLAIRTYLQHFIYLLHGIGAALMILVVLAISGVKVKKHKEAYLVLGFCILSLLNSYLAHDFMRSDLIWDALLSILGIFAAIFFFVKAESNKRLQLAGTIIILGIFLSTNIEQLITQNSTVLKNLFDWRNQILIPGLVFIAFIDIGSIYNTIQRVSKIVKQKAEMDKEIEISKSIQFSNLPESKSKSGNWRWHGLYKPASILAGDWYDVRELVLSDQRTILVAAMVDVTGHGISAAMMTSNIASHWSQWTRGVTQHESGLEAYLQLAPQRIHEGLIGLRSNLGCSMAAIIFDQTESKLYYTTAGHPGILSGSESQFRYHSTSGSRPGSPSENAMWEAKTTTIEPHEDMIVLYTDGIVPPGIAASQWLGRVKQEMRRSQTGLLRQIAGQILANSRSFRKSPEVEDDLTILILKKEKFSS